MATETDRTQGKVMGWCVRPEGRRYKSYVRGVRKGDIVCTRRKWVWGVSISDRSRVNRVIGLGGNIDQ